MSDPRAMRGGATGRQPPCIVRRPRLTRSPSFPPSHGRAQVTELCQVYAGPHPANSVAFDRSGSLVAVASDDGTIKVFNVDTAAAIVRGQAEEDASATLNELRGHEEAVQGICFEPTSNRYLVSCSSDTSVRVWQ